MTKMNSYVGGDCIFLGAIKKNSINSFECLYNEKNRDNMQFYTDKSLFQ